MGSLQFLQTTSTLNTAAQIQRPYLPLRGLESCSTMTELKQFHAQIYKFGLSADNYVMGGVLKTCLTIQNGDLDYGFKMFDKMPKPDTMIYNTIMKGYLKWDSPKDVIYLYLEMLGEFACGDVIPDSFTLPIVIQACCGVEEGRQIHAHVVKFGFGEDGVSMNNLIYMYVSFGYLEEGRKVFDKMPRRNVVSWTSLITGYALWGLVDEAFKAFELMPERNSVSWNAMINAYVQSNQFHEAFALFDRMCNEKIALDKFVATSMLLACTGLGALEQGKWIHGYIERSGIEIDSKLATSIIDMYCKCGCLEKAFEVFHGLRHKGLSSWNSIIGGMAMHGRGEAAIKLFEEMEREMVSPDHITFLNLLVACAHSGLVEEGRHCFRYMKDAYRIEPGKEHFGSMVDLLGRSGKLDEAKQLIDEMPVSPDASILGAFAGACRIHKNIILAEQIGKKAIELEPNNSGRYVLLANLYADSGRWEDVANVRKLMDDRRVKKVPGSSMIELDGVLNEFVAGERTHPDSKKIYAKIEEMLECIRSSGYVPDTDGVCHDLDKEGKENSLYYHSEKLAIAYGLLKTKPGETLRISKNLRICKDCHQASKLVSKVFGREIIVRDRNRFHWFKQGECSCKDFW